MRKCNELKKNARTQRERIERDRENQSEEEQREKERKDVVWSERTPTVVLPGQLPDDERLVSGGGQDHLRVLRVGGDLCDPSE